MKKNLRYYLFIAALMMVASVSAQVWAQEPVASMQSTSSMVGSGSSLPSAAVGGASIADVQGGVARGPRRTESWGDSGDGWEGGDWGDRADEPFEDPIGAMPWVMMVMMCVGYAAWRKRGSGTAAHTKAN